MSASKITWKSMSSIIPTLTKSLHKGQAGRVAVVGGCEQYTGAPYYSAVSSIKAGGDIAFVICTRSAAIPIKAYSPELIVHPLMLQNSDVAESNDSERQHRVRKAAEAIAQLMPRLHVLVIGPGLGRDEVTLEVAAAVIDEAKRQQIPIVLDGDGLYLITQRPELITGYQLAVLTPNHNEYKKLYEKVVGNEFDSQSDEHKLIALCKKLGNVTLIKKGQYDLIANGFEQSDDDVIAVRETAGAKRCGGQGDILTGILAVALHWAKTAATSQESGEVSTEALRRNILIAGVGASYLLRKSSAAAFRTVFRGLSAPDIINHVAPEMQLAFPVSIDE